MEETGAPFGAVNSDHQRHSRATRTVAEEFFKAETVLVKLLTDLGH
jgi:hypothetical protein